MTIKELLQKERQIWGDQKLTLEQIIVRMGVVFGDICRIARKSPKDKQRWENPEELKKELWNFITATIRWCDDLGFDPEECIKIALEAQEKGVKNRELR